MNECDMKTHFVADKLVRLKVGQELVVQLLLRELPIQVFWVVLQSETQSTLGNDHIIHAIPVGIYRQKGVQIWRNTG